MIDTGNLREGETHERSELYVIRYLETVAVGRPGTCKYVFFFLSSPYYCTRDEKHSY